MVEILLLAFGSKNSLIVLFFLISNLYFFFSKIDDSDKPLKIHPLPHMYVVKDLVPVGY